MIAVLDKIVIAIYGILIWVAFENMFYLQALDRRVTREWHWIAFFNFSLIIQAVVFIVMQVQWLQDPYYPTDPSFMTIGWSVYNWLSSVTLLAFAKIIYIYLRWERR